MIRLYNVLPLLLIILHAGCRPHGPAVPDEPQADPFGSPAEVERAGMDETSAQGPDTLHPGDTLHLRILGATEMDVPALIVDRGGHVHVALLGDVLVGGITLSEAEAAVLERLRKYDKVSEVSLQLVGTAGRRVSVSGAVEKPGNVAIVGDGRLAQVLADAGGPRMANTGDKLVGLADMDGAQLVRDGKVLPVDFVRALEGDPRHNVRVRSGDVIVVPPAVHGRIVVLGNVNKPRTLPFQRGMRLSEALAEAGGLAQSADSQDVRVLRGGYRKPKLYVTNAQHLFEGRASDPILAAGDIVYVSKHWFATVGEVIEKVVPAVATAAVITTLTRD
ncbi:MAG: hypothetical protein CVU63_02435 [Deltaproteobacteria bacterium HGW-Deltaproteobacteria-20]|jgi:polysaccharide export outer membrane protein|nr:MAG: hypothetical protein CVU63_02435 [Deltaproteobacteria bacterium HGW-Deltaproteobacteria-20]